MTVKKEHDLFSVTFISQSFESEKGHVIFTSSSHSLLSWEAQWQGRTGLVASCLKSVEEISTVKDSAFHVPVCDSERRRIRGNFKPSLILYPLKAKLFTQNLDSGLLLSGFCQTLGGDSQPNVVLRVGKVVNLNTKHLSLLWALGYLRVCFWKPNITGHPEMRSGNYTVAVVSYFLKMMGNL